MVSREHPEIPPPLLRFWIGVGSCGYEQGRTPATTGLAIGF
jgi:hypothetical protein